MTLNKLCCPLKCHRNVKPSCTPKVSALLHAMCIFRCGDQGLQPWYVVCHDLDACCCMCCVLLWLGPPPQPLCKIFWSAMRSGRRLEWVVSPAHHIGPDVAVRQQTTLTPAHCTCRVCCCEERPGQAHRRTSCYQGIFHVMSRSLQTLQVTAFGLLRVAVTICSPGTGPTASACAQWLTCAHGLCRAGRGQVPICSW